MSEDFANIQNINVKEIRHKVLNYITDILLLVDHNRYILIPKIIEVKLKLFTLNEILQSVKKIYYYKTN